MTPTRLRFEVLALAAFAVAASACGNLLGVGDFEDAPADTSTTASSGGGATTTTTSSQGGGGASSSSQGGGGASSSSQGGGGGAPECVTPADCAGMDTDCQARTCEGGVCGLDFAQDGAVLTTQTPGDCLTAICDGLGGETKTDDDQDFIDDGNGCTVDRCLSSTPTNDPEMAGTACNQGGGKLCDGAGSCVECLGASDCVSNVCQLNLCVAAACIDGVQNGTETDIDCGGAGCAPCADSLGCNLSTDCVSKVCFASLCQAPICTDAVKNGGESDIDCGSVCPTKCLAGKACSVNIDCVGDFCTGGVCAPTCIDAVKNGLETDVDCGGPNCPDCATNQGCANGSDCATGVCIGNLCKPASCSDGVQNGFETGPDCGGATCNPCGVNGGCYVPSDCTTGVCVGAMCQAATCADVVLNGQESDVDCGGPVCAKCANGLACLASTDCTSSFCLANVCQGAQCNDTFKNGTETDVDCGGPACSPCANNKICTTGSDCQSSVCTGGLCKAPTCFDGTKNGSEVGVDCGGGALSGCPGCGDGVACTMSSDCLGNYCAAGLCCTPATTQTTCMGGLCGVVTDNCGQAVTCATCIIPATCGGTGTNNVCGCAPPCPIWSKRFGDGSLQQPNDVVIDTSGNVYVVGFYQGTLDFGAGVGSVFTSAGGSDIFMVKLSSAGTFIWARSFGDASAQFANAVALDSAGNVIVAGSFAGTVSFGGGVVHTSAGGFDGFIAKFDTNGNIVSSQRSGDAANQFINDVAVDGSDAVVVTGHFNGTIDFGTIPNVPLVSAGSNDIFIARSKQGSVTFQKAFGDASAQSGQKLDVDNATNDIFVTGETSGTVDFGGGALVGAGGNDAFLVRLTAAGAHVWSRIGGDASNQGGYGVTLDTAGNVVVGGGFAGTIDLGLGTLTSAGGNDVFVASYKLNGTPNWGARYGGSGVDALRDVKRDKSDNVVFVGDSTGTIDFGGGLLSGGGSNDAFLVKLDKNGNHVWSKMGGDAASQQGAAVATDASTNVVIAGVLQGTLDVGLGPMTSAGLQDIVIAKFNP